MIDLTPEQWAEFVEGRTPDLRQKLIDCRRTGQVPKELYDTLVEDLRNSRVNWLSGWQYADGDAHYVMPHGLRDYLRSKYGE